MALADATDWIEEFNRPGVTWYVKRLAANDTLASGGHQAGPYIPKSVLFEVLPELYRPQDENPDFHFDLYVDSHPDHRRIRAVWYNRRLHGSGTRDETRLTNFGGGASALLDPDSTGSLAAFVFRRVEGIPECHVWICDDSVQADLFEDLVGIVEPKQYILWKPGIDAPQGELFEVRSSAKSCWLSENEIPPLWLETFPTGAELIEKTFNLRPPDGMNPDVRLLRRRECEFQLFRSIEEAFWCPKIKAGFDNLEAFVSIAQSILQSRKSRSGKSLELHAHHIFLEEGFTHNEDFSHGAVLNGNRRPDFVFPNAAAFADDDFPSSQLRMLAAKTSCKDRWRQILNETDKVEIKHLLTLQEGVSENQFNEMTDAGVRLVVPSGLHNAYPEAIRAHLLTLEEFIADTRLLSKSSSKAPAR